jgi:hypothetical protein
MADNPAEADIDDAEVSKEGEEKVDQSMTPVSESDEASHKKEDGDDDEYSKKEDAAETEQEQEEKEESKEEPKKTKVVDWPLRDIAEPHPNDVLYGRGGECTREIGVEERVLADGSDRIGVPIKGDTD